MIKITQHHEDAFRPICVLTPHDGVDPRHWRDTLLAVGPGAPRPGFGIVEIRCALGNIGPGTALDVGLMFRFHDMAGYTTQPWELGPLRAGELRGSADEPLRIPLQFEPRFTETDFAFVSGKSWELILVYKDIFGNSFHTLHPKNPLQMNRLYQKAGVELYYAPPQPWAIPSKGKPPQYSGQGLSIGFAPSITHGWWRRFRSGILHRIGTMFSRCRH